MQVENPSESKDFDRFENLHDLISKSPTHYEQDYLNDSFVDDWVLFKYILIESLLMINQKLILYFNLSST